MQVIEVQRAPILAPHDHLRISRKRMLRLSGHRTVADVLLLRQFARGHPGHRGRTGRTAA